MPKGMGYTKQSVKKAKQSDVSQDLKNRKNMLTGLEKTSYTNCAGKKRY